MTETTQSSSHEVIRSAMDHCRAGHTIHIVLPDNEVTIDAEKGEITYTFTVTRSDGSTAEIEGIAVWKLLSDHEFRID